MVCVIALKLPMSIYRAIRVSANGNYGAMQGLGEVYSFVCTLYSIIPQFMW